MTNQNEKVDKMHKYFNNYINKINKYSLVKEAVKVGEPKETIENSSFDRYGIKSYTQKLKILIIPKNKLADNDLEEKLILNIGSMMNPDNFPDGSSMINCTYAGKENNYHSYNVKIYYAPQEPVFNNSVTKKDVTVNK